MTDRKPHDISIETWVDRQIRSAQEAGAFENLPGAGKPIPASSTDELAWVRGYLRRENLPSDALLPTPLRLRKEIENLRDTVAGLRTEDAVRAEVRELNRRIMDYLRIPVGPVIPVSRVDVDAVVAQWVRDRDALARARAEARRVQPAPAPSPARRRGLRWGRRRP
ncbi:J-domain-containing protein [Rhodococcoides corynebacterioides]|uniref:DUF1992 domain-containing protein n=1 Tax=Rhodococcoides corynebacterioides TaxID=53972 RepID=A0ABS7P8I3_9NOCA|nr:DUF1992 domain-containing protein [Rhodococcus corynebacterioides]MBY6351409.1 DUF1992 domain-containing protein [Rhodococcus corynebacterioides]MBY6368336.1 DUF1992 domain-containing protein [Rhodococcus corynebacterioides]MBY6409235.1 DUF1992 domain-containing protein [Rhodococcus corynebacterioides]